MLNSMLDWAIYMEGQLRRQLSVPTTLSHTPPTPEFRIPGVPKSGRAEHTEYGSLVVPNSVVAEVPKSVTLQLPNIRSLELTQSVGLEDREFGSL